MSDQSERARRLSEFADSLLMPQRYEHRGAEFPPEDREFHELQALAEELADIRIEPPKEFSARLSRRLPALAADQSIFVRVWRSIVRAWQAAA